MKLQEPIYLPDSYFPAMLMDYESIYESDNYLLNAVLYTLLTLYL